MKKDKKNIERKAFILFLLVLLITSITACKKFVQEPPPVTGISSATAFSNNQSAAAVTTSIYQLMAANGSGLSSGVYSVGLLTGLASDELTNYNTGDPLSSEFYTNTLNSRDIYVFWPEIYQQIHTANAVIEGLAGSSGVTSTEKLQLVGEAKFMRAFLHFYAVNLYGDVPIVTTTDYLINNSIHRSSKDQVYRQIIADLKDAEKNLPNHFVDPVGNTTTGRIRPNKYAALALLSRAYLYTGNWAGADSAATAIISNANYSLVPNLDGVFLANSPEAIWQLQPVQPGFNTNDGSAFVLISPPASSNQPALSSQLQGAFETGDSRFTHWVGSFTDPLSGQTYFFPYKYKIYAYDPSVPLNEYTMVLRLAEQYLIRAEAKAQNKDLSGSQADLNVIRRRAGLANTTAADLTSLLTAIQHERQVELFTEWGHRWFDLKRTNTINTVMSIVTPLKGGTWKPELALLPIPFSDLQIDANLTQNSGY